MLAGHVHHAADHPARAAVGGAFELRRLARGAGALVVLGDVRRKRGRPRDPEADGRILAAASSLILLRGFDSMTVDEVATNAGVGKATVYRRWARKEDLAVAAMEQLYRDEMPSPDTGSIRGDLLSTCNAQSAELVVGAEPEGAGDRHGRPHPERPCLV